MEEEREDIVADAFVITREQSDQDCQVREREREREVKLESNGSGAVIKRSLSEKRNANLIDFC